MVTYLRNNQAVLWPGLEPATRKSQVQRPNHYTTEPFQSYNIKMKKPDLKYYYTTKHSIKNV